ncbi:pyruvate, phosphate dikinase [Candidatus Woesearchaeota archaeon]|nr:pyruvate, phosphate dikinase [Candidatus Woesearchaeota archaeon]
MKKYVYQFEEGNYKDKKLLGGKGAGLCEMTKMGLPVPPGFIITTEACLDYNKENRLPSGLAEEIRQNIQAVEKKLGKNLGNENSPLLFSVRSGAAISMPGMMDTILNLGLNDKTVQGLAISSGNERFAYDSYRRFLQLFGNIALSVEDEKFDSVFNEIKAKYGVKLDTEMNAQALKEACESFKKVLREEQKEFPQDVYKQLGLAVIAVFKSWMGKRAVDYRREFNITPEIADGTAVNVCTMVFGNMGNDSLTGVAFTRDPGTGENVLFGEYLINSQGEDVVAGIRTPKPIAEMVKEVPVIYEQLEGVRKTLENHFREVQDFEFTVEKKKLWMLQTRNGKLNAAATVKTSKDLADEGLITREQALLRVNPEMVQQLLHKSVAPKFTGQPLTKGTAASPGVATGKVVFTADEAERRGKIGEIVILVREETKPEDVHGFFRARGILTSRGGKTSHAAVVARGMGKACVVGCEALTFESNGKVARVGETHILEGDIITVDGSTGNVYLGEVPTIDRGFSEELSTILSWADSIRTLGVRANADTPTDAIKAREFGAEGIGLCRTERMFNAAERLPIVRDMILADSQEERIEALKQLFPMQKNDFKEILKAMEGLPVTVRLLDPPLHEFLPSAEELSLEIDQLRGFKHLLDTMEQVPKSVKIKEDPILKKYVKLLRHMSTELAEIKDTKLWDKILEKEEIMLKKVRALAEVNPMLGHRGVRLGITYPEIYEMQIRALLEASAELIKEGKNIMPELMVPQVCTAQELIWVHDMLQSLKAEVEALYGAKVNLKFGSMIEVVRACTRAGRLAEIAEFFSFGTNDLTQATFSFSREDAESKFLPLYNQRKILLNNPFETLDIKGVGRLMDMSIFWGRKTRPDLKVGICGEHGGHPKSIEFCHYLTLNYVSCSVYRVPVARLAAAHAKLKEGKEDFLYKAQ